ncbi:Coenzyme F420 hydrogenase/dehydrogenase, beta subunit C-terminal domain [Bacteroides thetaiotaomicron]|uniref:Coenzyme F420 hydrogenase/dehydrogenase, beta subunit C-terminal domain n=1 Tax=Bacteroides thetaiotaomicron TaxID=818 RepID=UPI0039C28688
MKKSHVSAKKKKTVSSHFNSSFFERDALVKGISFRNKAFGWKKYSFVLTLSKTVATGDKKIVSSSCIFYDNAYMQAFLANFSLRPSCYNCPAKAGKSGSDIMIGDFWGINNIMPDFDDDRGCSLVILNSNRGEAVFSRLNINYKKVLYAEVVSNNSNIEVSVTEPPYRKLFMILFSRFGFKMAHRVLFSKNIIYKVLRCIWLQTCKMP